MTLTRQIPAAKHLLTILALAIAFFSFQATSPTHAQAATWKTVPSPTINWTYKYSGPWYVRTEKKTSYYGYTCRKRYKKMYFSSSYKRSSNSHRIKVYYTKYYWGSYYRC